MGKKKVSTNWYVHHQDQMEWYESQSAVLDAADLFIANYEHGIWSDKQAYLSLGHADGETVDSDLFKRRYSANALKPTCIASIFTIDLFIKTKEDWIIKYGSDLLQQSLKAGYECNDGYLAERLARDYPGFKINDLKYKKVDTPTEKCLQACLEYEYSHCSTDREEYYITIDNYLGKYQLIARIDSACEITMVEPSTSATSEKADWIHKHGSNLLQHSFMAGYDCNDRYRQERLVYDHPGFTIAPGKYRKVDSPSESCLYACLGYEGAYCSANNKDFYITIDGFLGKYQIIKPIGDRQIVSHNLLTDVESLKSTNSISLINSSLLTPLGLTQLISVCTATSTLIYVTIEYLPKIFQAIVSHI
jgi:hypothetical protein